MHTFYCKYQILKSGGYHYNEYSSLPWLEFWILRKFGIALTITRKKSLCHCSCFSWYICEIHFSIILCSIVKLNQCHRWILQVLASLPSGSCPYFVPVGWSTWLVIAYSWNSLLMTVQYWSQFVIIPISLGMYWWFWKCAAISSMEWWDFTCKNCYAYGFSLEAFST